MLMGSRDRNLLPIGIRLTMNPQGGMSMTADYINLLEGKTVATANLEQEDDSTRRYVAVLTFTDGSRITFEGDIDFGMVYSLSVAAPATKTEDKLPDEQRFVQMIQHMQKPTTDMNVARHEVLVMLMVLYRMARQVRQ